MTPDDDGTLEPLPAPAQGDDGASGPVPGAQVVFHSDLSRIGDSAEGEALFAAGTIATIGRSEPLFGVGEDADHGRILSGPRWSLAG